MHRRTVRQVAPTAGLAAALPALHHGEQMSARNTDSARPHRLDRPAAQPRHPLGRTPAPRPLPHALTIRPHLERVVSRARRAGELP
ncbi:hypothetical protein ACI2LJ_30665 [Streptomyces sp. NPDC088090]|uniref:hypothetical protein n=1 Tax=Streptomyces sp. NPDC088090 TaxID=3365822 RepID=UPI00384FFB4E